MRESGRLNQGDGRESRGRDLERAVTMAEQAVPLKAQSASWVKGGLKSRAGTLLLYPDQLVHVGSKAAQIGAAFGAIGILVTRQIANAGAARKVEAGGKSVMSIPLATISEAHGQKGKLDGNSIIVRTTTGDEYRFGGVKFDRWSEDLGRALTNAGRQVTFTDEGLTAK